MKNKKGFTLIELIIVIAILAIIMLIGTAAYSSIQERMKVRADKATAAQIGKAIKIRETDVGEENGIGLYPEVIEYDSIDGIENYIAKEIKPQSMEDGNFVATAFQTQTGKKIVVGIGKKAEGSESYSIGDKVYNGKDESGWAWSEDTKIEEFLKDESVSGSISSGTGSEEFPGVAVVENSKIEIGAYIEYIPTGEPVEIAGDISGTGSSQTFTPSETTRWRVLRNNSGQLDIISAGSAGVLTLKGEAGYANSVGILKTICQRYTDGGKYATKALPLGYTDGADTITGEINCSTVSSMEDACDNFWSAYEVGKCTEAKEYIGNSSSSDLLWPYMDAGWLDLETNSSDMSALREIQAGSVWLASRSIRKIYYSNNEWMGFYVHCIFAETYDGLDYYIYVSPEELYEVYPNNYVDTSADSLGVCPIVSLKSGIKFLYGDGTLDNPYRMTEEPPSWKGKSDKWEGDGTYWAPAY